MREKPSCAPAWDNSGLLPIPSSSSSALSVSIVAIVCLRCLCLHRPCRGRCSHHDGPVERHMFVLSSFRGVCNLDSPPGQSRDTSTLNTDGEADRATCTGSSSNRDPAHAPQGWWCGGCTAEPIFVTLSAFHSLHASQTMYLHQVLSKVYSLHCASDTCGPVGLCYEYRDCFLGLSCCARLWGLCEWRRRVVSTIGPGCPEHKARERKGEHCCRVSASL